MNGGDSFFNTKVLQTFIIDRVDPQWRESKISCDICTFGFLFSSKYFCVIYLHQSQKCLNCAHSGFNKINETISASSTALHTCVCLQVQTELRRWLWKCHNQNHLTPAKRSITQITIRARGGLGRPPSSGNISSV